MRGRHLRSAGQRQPVLAALVVSVVSLVASASAQHGLPETDPDAPLGLGIALLRTADAPPPLRLYSHPALAEVPHEILAEHATVTDSVTFVPRPGGASVQTAPPGFLPDVLDIERGFVGMRIRTLATDWVQAVTNRADGRTAWVRRDRVQIYPWPEALLVSLVTVDPEANPIRAAPSDDAPVLAATPDGWRLRTLAVQDAWVQVSTLGLADRVPPSGWVRWTDGARLLVGGVGQE